MSHRCDAVRRVTALAVLLALFCCTARAVLAQASTSLSGTVTANGAPVAKAAVTLTGSSLTQHTTTNAQGRFTFNALDVGSYTVTASGPAGTASISVDLGTAGTSVTLDIAAIKKIGGVAVTSAPTLRASGTDVVLNSTELSHAPSVNSLPDILTQIPTAARGSNGQIHINGDHNGVNYVIDGVQIPEGLNRVLGNEIDPSDIGFAEILEGAYPAQYGDKFAAVVDISTKSKTGPPGAAVDLRGGSYDLFDGVVSAHTPVGTDGSLYVGARMEQDGRALDPPVPDPVHDFGSIASQFLRLSLPLQGQDTLTLDLTHSLQTFQIPPDTSSGTPAFTDDNEIQDDTYASLIYRHAFGNNAVLTLGPSYKRSRILDTNDPRNDLIGQVQGPDAAPCTDFSNCSFFSVFADRTDINARFNADYDLRVGKHEFRAGGIYGAETLQKDYVMTVPATSPDGSTLEPFTVTDTAPNVAHTEEFFAQDGWQMSDLWRLDYGVREDMFQVFSTDFHNGFAQTSPRVKLTRKLGAKADVYAYFGRLFVPFSLESVSPVASAELFGTSVTPGTTNDLKPQRDSLYEIGGHMPLGRGDLGVRISHKVSTDWLDDTQVGATNLHQDINFPQGRVDSQNFYYNQPMARNSRFYASVSHAIAVNSLNCETQLLQNCAAFGPPGGDFVQADHDQHWDVTSGLLWNDLRGGWFSIDGEYGSGLSRGDTTLCPPYPLGDAINCKVPPHLTFDAVKGWAVAPHMTLALAVRNMFNDRYAIVLDNSLQGTHYARPRTIELRLSDGR
ncbi:MAG TPA: TonB-dependent receptor [Candidatus Baltobacteraceae bacterium]|nr:TonB-dependent receptor [Candidatus Baltobacteraceae bacterium]